LTNGFDVLIERGFIKQISHPEIQDVLAQKRVTFYTGYDPTADSLHIGHFLQLMAMGHLQRAGHLPVVLVGGGTATVGDPSGRNDIRSMMTMEQIARNAEALKAQMARFFDFADDKAIMVNNADWLLKLNYVEVLREVGVHFTVNRMLAAEAYKARYEQGLTFLEFNYMIMQAYDFLHLYRTRGVTLQLGGDDQWSNILAGVDLIRRIERADAFAMTFALLTNSDGSKMGKTLKGALWLDAGRTSPYDFYQYWRNVEDAKVKQCLSLLTFLDMDEVERLGSLRDTAINDAKKRLAFEVTQLIHGQKAAEDAAQASEALFGGGGDLENMPTTVLTGAQLSQNGNIVDIMVLCGLARSKGEARRLIEGGGVYANEARVTDIAQPVDEKDLSREGVILRKGKKVYHRVLLAP
jgi:tyrosyl-tRNA synthetase